MQWEEPRSIVFRRANEFHKGQVFARKELIESRDSVELENPKHHLMVENGVLVNPLGEKFEVNETDEYGLLYSFFVKNTH